MKLKIKTNQVFFKTVRSDGSSLWAHPPLKKTYVIGQRYQFDKRLPARVFGDHFIQADGTFDPERVYNDRAESGGGNRVFVCRGNFFKLLVPVLDIGDLWTFSHTEHYLAEQSCSSDFVVIGEIPLPAFYKGIRPAETPLSEYYRGHVLFDAHLDYLKKTTLKSLLTTMDVLE